MTSFEEDFEKKCQAFFILHGIYLFRDIPEFDVNRRKLEKQCKWQLNGRIYFLFQEGIRESYPTKKFTTPNQVIPYQKHCSLSEVCLRHMQGTNESFGPGNVRVKPNRQNTPVSSYDGVTSLCRYSSESEAW